MALEIKTPLSLHAVRVVDSQYPARYTAPSVVSSLLARFGAMIAASTKFKNGADFLGGFKADKVTIKLKGDQAEEYCNIFRNCYELETGKFGTTFKSYKASITKWHGGGDEQGKTIVDNITTDGKTTRRKEQRLSF